MFPHGCGRASTVLPNDCTLLYDQSKSEIDQLGDRGERNNVILSHRGSNYSEDTNDSQGGHVFIGGFLVFLLLAIYFLGN